MPDKGVSLPVLAAQGPWRVTPTDVSQFVRLEQCERFLRFRLAERAGQRFMEEYDVNPQRITPLLSLSGNDFEEGIEKKLAKKHKTINYAKETAAHDRPENNAEVAAQARNLKTAETVFLFQPRLSTDLNGWALRGDLDLVRLERKESGELHVMIGDMKSTVQVKVEHRLQIAFYRLMLEAILTAAGIAFEPVELGILFRVPADPTPEDEAEFRPKQEAARRLFGLEDALLEVVADPHAYVQSAHDLVLSHDSTARRVARTPFEQLPFHLSFKCDGCLYNEFCLKWSADNEDLSLLPYMTGTDKEALRRLGVTTIKSLAVLKDLAPGGKNLVAVPAHETEVKQIAAAWPVGPRLDELIHRAKSYRRHVRKDGSESLSYIPDKGNSSLPVSTPELNPNLVRVYIDAQCDYLEERVYLLGALVVACRQGEPVQRQSIVRMTDGPPDTVAKERRLFVDWTRALITAVVELAESSSPATEKKSAPIHVFFFDRYEQRLLLEALARNFPPIIRATPPLYDFLTQIAAYDSPVASYLTEELRTFKNFPMTCQSLQSVAQYLKFDWTAPHNFREHFKARMFDYIGKLEIDGVSEWYTRRSRFSSSVPLEYAYAAWGALPKSEKGKHDPFSAFRETAKDVLIAFQARRLEAMEHVAASIYGNPNTQKTPFVLPDLAHYENKAHDLAHALHEFVTIERLVELNDWKRTRHELPERRVLMGETLLVRYVEADQDPGVAERNRDNERRRKKREEFVAAFKAANPGKQVRLPKDQKAESDWSSEGLRVNLRLETAGVDCELHEALALSTLREGDRLVLFPRWTVDERLPLAEQKEFTPTPKQMLYGNRAELMKLVATEKDSTGRITAGYAEVELRESFGGEWSRGFVFGAINRTLEAGKLYTLDPCPNDWYGYWCSQVVDGLCAGGANALYTRLVSLPKSSGTAGAQAQQKFLNGLDEFHAANLLHGFEPAKREFIGGHASTPILLVQGPPGTGKSYSTAFAIFSRIQAAMAKKQPFRVFVSCKTHAATDVLLRNVQEVQQKLLELRNADLNLFKKFFDERLLEVTLIRVAPHDGPPPGIFHLHKDDENDAEAEFNADAIQEPDWSVVGITPGGVYGMLKKKWPKNIFGQQLCDLLVLDEASQMNLPEALMAALPLKDYAQIIVVGDHRQMPPIVKHDWDTETRRTFADYQVYESLFDTLREMKPPMIQFSESFRLHESMAEFLRQEIYRHDGIAFHSKKRDLLADRPVSDDLVAAVLHPEFPLVVVVHDECDSQVRNPFEQRLIEPILHALVDHHGLDAEEGLGIVVPHRAQRAALRQAFPKLCIMDPASGLPARSAIDTVERFQGGERTLILVSATESDRAYLLASCDFLLDPRRLTVALSRAKRKMILVASRSIFSLFSTDEATFGNAQMWKNLLLRTCSTRLWEGTRDGVKVAIWGGK